MKATLLKRLFSAVEKGSSPDVIAVCKRIVEDQKDLGHNKLAQSLERALERVESKRQAAAHPAAKHSNERSFTSLPSNKRDSSPLVQVIEHEQLRHHMVLPPEIEDRFATIEKEYAARGRLATYGLKAKQRVLFYGPPGCGKSLGAERLAWATGLPLFKVRFDTLISSYFGETATNLGKVFESVSQKPCALFLDECDTIARSRTDRNDVGEVSRVVNMLLQLLEDYRGDGIVIAATNFYKSLDHAIFRRFDEIIEIPKPGIVEIARLLKSTLSSLNLDRNVNLDTFAGSLDGFSFSEVERIARNAAKRCVLSNRKKVTQSDLEEASAEVKRHF